MKVIFMIPVVRYVWFFSITFVFISLLFIFSSLFLLTLIGFQMSKFVFILSLFVQPFKQVLLSLLQGNGESKNSHHQNHENHTPDQIWAFSDGVSSANPLSYTLIGGITNPQTTNSLIENTVNPESVELSHAPRGLNGYSSYFYPPSSSNSVSYLRHDWPSYNGTQMSGNQYNLIFFLTFQTSQTLAS